MIDALLYAVRDGIRKAGFNYGKAECEIMESGKPPERCGKFFVAVHSGHSSSGPANDNNLDEIFGFSVTLTMRVDVPLDRVGDQQIARNINLVPLGLRQGFNAKLEQLRGFLHMNWGIVVLTNQTPPSANDNLSAWATGTVYGFCEPTRYKDHDVPRLEGGEWLGEDGERNAIISELRFDGARRFQRFKVSPVGPYI